MAEGTRFQRLIPEVLHPNPLTDLTIAEEASKEAGAPIWQKNNIEPRLPYALVQNPEFPPVLGEAGASTSAPGASSSMAAASTEFTLLPPNEIKTVIFCTGQVYYLLHRARVLNNKRDVAIVRVEQLCPFPFWEVAKVVDFYGESLEEIVWCQEESFNSGAWQHVEPRLETAIRETQWLKGSSSVKTKKKNRCREGV